ncbi:RNA polymerase [Aeromonas phage AerS_266]|nr:RNA polymerase [Aeromonas phage AerS_266]
MPTLAEILKPYEVENLLPSAIFNKIIKETGFKIPKDDQSFYKALYPDFDDYDARHNCSVNTPIYLNDFDFNKEEDRDRIISLLRTEYEGNCFDTVASCECKKYRSNIYLDMNVVCEDCGHSVTKPLVDKIETKVWLKTPDKVAGFLNPSICKVFFDNLNTKTPKVNLVEYWINSDLRKEKRFRDPTNTAFKIACKIEAFRDTLGLEFGYNEFIENIDLIIDASVNQDLCGILDVDERSREHYSRFWNKFKHLAVSQYFPIPNKITTIIESDQRDRYINKEKTDLDKFFFTIADMFPAYDIRSEENGTLMGKHFTKLRAVMYKVMEAVVFKKKGMIRYHAGAGKLPMTGRSIITGESGVCRSDTIVVPWLYGITCYDKHLSNWLYRVKGYSPLKAKEIIRSAANYRHPVIEEFFDWIETNQYAMAIAGRNPSIQYLSARTFFLKFNRDVEDKSIRIPITVVKEFGRLCAEVKPL